MKPNPKCLGFGLPYNKIMNHNLSRQPALPLQVMLKKPMQPPSWPCLPHGLHSPAWRGSSTALVRIVHFHLWTRLGCRFCPQISSTICLDGYNLQLFLFFAGFFTRKNDSSPTVFSPTPPPSMAKKPFASHTHGQNAFIPTRDHLPSAHSKLQGFTFRKSQEYGACFEFIMMDPSLVSFEVCWFIRLECSAYDICFGYIIYSMKVESLIFNHQ